MNHVLAILIGLILLVATVMGIIHDDAIGYFFREPDQLLVVLLIACLGGMVVWAIVSGLSRLSASTKHRLQVFCSGVAAIGATVLVAWVAFNIYSLWSLFHEAVPVWMQLVFAVEMILLAVFAWLHFVRALRTLRVHSAS